MIEKEGSVFYEYIEAGFSIEYRDASHRYWLIETIDGKHIRKPVVSITSALKVLDKPALMGWAEASGCEGGVKLERMGELEGVSPAEAINRVRMFDMGMKAKRDAGAERGTLVHRVLEVYVSTGEPPNISDFEHEHRGYVQGLCQWLLDYQPVPVAVEAVVASRLHKFAGRLDLLAHGGLVDAGLELWDLKTSPSATIYDEAHLQAAAYDGAAFECGWDVDSVNLLAVGEDGSYNVTTGRASLDDFLAVLEVSRIMGRLRRDAG